MSRHRSQQVSTPHVVQVVTRRQLRGAEVFAAQLTDHLDARGWRVTLLGLYPAGEPPLCPRRAPSVDLDARRRPLSPFLIWKLRALLRRLRPAIVQANGSDTLKYSVAAKLAGGFRGPLVYRNISLSSHWLRGDLHRRWNGRLLALTDHVVAVSERSKRDLVATYGLDGEAISVLPRGVEIAPGGSRDEARRRLAAEAGFDAEAPIVAHVGSLTPEKNHAGLIEAFRLLGRSWPRAQLVCFGEGPLREEIEQRAAGLGARVVLAGARPDAAELAAGADLLVLFSDVEGMPGVVLEAGARGVPVVATDVGGVGEVITDGRTGLLVGAGDVEACAAAMGRLLESPALARELGEGLRSAVAESYGLESICERYDALYRRLLARSGEGA